MRGDEILEHRQSFAEVRRNWLLDDRTIRLGHQTAHPRKLLDLLAISSRTRVNHQIHRIKLFASLIVLKGTEHDVCDFFPCVGPNIDHFVVTLAVCDNTATVLLFHRNHLLVSLLELDVLLLRDNHVLDSDGNACTHRPCKTKPLQTIESFDRCLVTSGLIGPENHIRNLLLATGLVEETKLSWPDLVEDYTPNRCFDHTRA